MSLRTKCKIQPIAMLLVCSMVPVSILASFRPGDSVSSESAGIAQGQTLGVLTIQGNRGISLNDTDAISGATILSGAQMETPTEVDAIVTLNGRGSIEIESNTKVTLQFGQKGIDIIITEGCVGLRTNKGTIGILSGPDGVIGQTDATPDGKLEGCYGRIAKPEKAAGTNPDGLFAMSAAAAAAVIFGDRAAAALPVAPRGILY